MPGYFTGLNYSLGDEDSEVEFRLAPDGARRMAVVAGSGGRVLPLLARRPDRLTCFDTSKIQLHLTRLRIESARAFDLEEFAAFWGYPPTPMPPDERKQRFLALPLQADAARSLAALLERHGWTEIIYVGRFERMFRFLAAINHFFTGGKGRKLFDCPTIETQVAYLETGFPRRRWRAVVALLANATVLNTILYRGEFPEKNVPGSTFANFHNIYDRLFRTISVRESFFAQLSFFGRLVTREAGLLEVDPDIFGRIRNALEHTAIDFVHADIVQAIAHSNDLYDFVSLSDVPSFLPRGTERHCLQRMRPRLRPGAVVVARGNLRVVAPNLAGFDDFSDELRDLSDREKTQLWRINAYRRH